MLQKCRPCYMLRIYLTLQIQLQGYRNKLSDHHYSEQCYNRLFQLDAVRRKKMVTSKRRFFFMVFFGVGNIRRFTSVLNQRYGTFHCWRIVSLRSITNVSVIEHKWYFISIRNRQMIHSLFLFRCSGHDLIVNTGRWTNTPMMDRISKYCDQTLNCHVLEDEKHFLMVCIMELE